ncbi:GAF domain-containing protein [Deinococcus navajonensis]|uniref:histidine kinase n=1 Tax=Deinococcus navajonensis TaxID=309884 RepID=A0ABV8XKG7_9DEIO
MSSPPPAGPALGERLQGVTEALAAAQTQPDVYEVVMGTALEAVGAVAGAVLLVSVDGARLELAAAQGEASGQTLWQDGPLNREVPGGDALLRQKALFFEHEGALVRAYPHLEKRTGGVAAVATAVLPMLLDGQPLGTLILDFREPHQFLAEEVRFLRTLASQCALALGRVRLLVSLQEELTQRRQTEQDLRRSETRFRRVVEDSPVAIVAGDLSGDLILANDACLNLLAYTRADFEAGQIDWTALTPSEFQAADELAFDQALARGRSDPYRKEMRTRTGERLPLEVVLTRYEGREPLVVGYLQDLRSRHAAEDLLRAHSAQLEAQVAARTRESEAARVRAEVLAALGDALQRATTPEEVAEQALHTLGPALRALSMLMVRLDGLGIRLPTLWGQTPEVITAYMTRPGLQLNEAPILDRVARAGQGLYLDNYQTQPGPLDFFPALAAGVEPIHLPGGTLAGFLVVWRLPEQGPWVEAECDLLRRAAGTLGLALERAEQARQLQARQEEEARRSQALAAFAELSRDLTLETDPYVLIHRTQQVVLGLLPPGFSSYFEPEGEAWQLRTQVGRADMPDVQAALEAGLPFRTPHLLQPWLSGEPHFEDGVDLSSEPGGERRTGTGATVTLPVHVGGQVRGVLAFALADIRHWSGEDRAVLETVGRQLTLALERAEQTGRLAEQNAELDARTRALEGFAHLTRDLGLDDDPYALIRRAQQVVLSLLPHGYAVYFEPEGARWVLRAQTGELRSEALQAVADAGLPYDKAHNLLTPYTTGEPYYQDQYAHDTDNLVHELVAHLGASATLPVLVGGQPLGVFAVVLFDKMRPWSGAERAVLETVVRSLGLALERARGVAELARRTQELARSNAELEQFAYIASHDLQAPIRAVTSFAGIIERRYSPALDDRGRLYLRQIMESGEHMKRLVDDLLTYSRVHTERRALQPTDAAVVFDAVAQRLEAAHESTGARITRGALPTVMSDAQQLDQLLQNLISNGLKYRREGVAPQVHVSATRLGRYWRFAVRDNGIGIEPEYRERIFVIFQRLHGREQYEGTGIGLAVCKKIVDLHGGELWVESTPGEGSTFFLTLPAA